jgi:hypothetical protein
MPKNVLPKPPKTYQVPKASELLNELAHALLAVADVTLRLQRVSQAQERILDEQLSQVQETAEKALAAASGPGIADSGEHPQRYYQAMILREFVRNGDAMPRTKLLELGAAMGYKHQGMAGFYRHGWLELLDEETVVITAKGRTVVEEAYHLLPEKFTPSDGTVLAA